MRWLLSLALVAACGGAKNTDARHPSKPAGCEVRLFHDAPTIPTENLGPVRASCDESVSDDECIRTLKDQACALGGDVIWGIADEPERKNNKKYWFGRAAVHVPK